MIVLCLVPMVVLEDRDQLRCVDLQRVQSFGPLPPGNPKILRSLTIGGKAGERGDPVLRAVGQQSALPGHDD